ncbi:condensation domain-containing protein [Gemmobacter sp. 24YEA27]|uniref:condensation domain-containing protein n=1 Tax=Gemmobacter sp. 24YEA27 TaxID=3040672 RepID=UPI0024B36A13|nr:condensation domain-containing protein [Gemmobacter sp. 24YEA27]
MRFDLAEGATLQDQIARTRDELAFAMEHAVLPFDRLVARINPPRDPLRIPLVSVMFNLQRVFLREKNYGALALVSVPSHSPGSLYDLNINVIGRSSGWRIALDYNAAMFSAETAGALVDLYATVLQLMLDRPATRISDLPGPMPEVTAPGVAAPESQAPAPAPAPFAVPPAHDLRLARIWASVLAREETAVRGNFFDLGGYSVLALRMLSAVQEEFGKRPSLAQFLEDPSFDGLANCLAEGRAEATGNPIWQLIEFQRELAPAPVLLTLNQTFLFQSVTRQIRARATLANLAIPGAEALMREADLGFEAAMQEAAALIRQIYGKRPLILFGLCVDGRLALRIAQLLEQAGCAPPMVAMIDTWAPGVARRLPAGRRLRHALRRRLARLSYFTRLRLRGRIPTGEYLRQFRLTRRLMAAFGQHGGAPRWNNMSQRLWMSWSDRPVTTISRLYG